MENSKYYTPTIEEFHVGFELEVLGMNSKEETLHSKVVITKQKNGFIQTDFVEPRVKYLDKEDIIDLGLELIPNEEKSNWIRFIGHIVIMGQKFDVILSFLPPMPKTEDLIEWSDPIIKLEGRISSSFPYVTIYNDCIKNKNELKHILTKERTSISIAPPRQKNN